MSAGTVATSGFRVRRRANAGGARGLGQTARASGRSAAQGGVGSDERYDFLGRHHVGEVQPSGADPNQGLPGLHRRFGDVLNSESVRSGQIDKHQRFHGEKFSREKPWPEVLDTGPWALGLGPVSPRPLFAGIYSWRWFTAPPAEPQQAGTGRTFIP